MTELRDTWRQAVKQFKAAGHSLDENDMDHYNSRVSTSSLMMKIMKMTTRWESIFNNEH
ncbi:MAG: hypothetical protein V8R83_01550 [Candidatus Gastranaerophilaceae bacterium]